MILLIPIIYRLVIDNKLCVTFDFSEVVQIYFTKPVRLKFGLIRVVAFGWCDLIRGCGLWLVCPYKRVWPLDVVAFGWCGLIRAIVFRWCGLIIAVAFGWCGRIRVVALFGVVL